MTRPELTCRLESIGEHYDTYTLRLDGEPKVVYEVNNDGLVWLVGPRPVIDAHRCPATAALFAHLWVTSGTHAEYLLIEAAKEELKVMGVLAL